ncbi:MAG: hypothetical protein KDK05_30130, partial [Candidatus Competibacteraceae bacterium]|nr:hypothetical protein [Candidatus Competibacteraceae bacterium]
SELAVLLRLLDDEEKITDYQKQTGNEWNCGKLELENKKLINLTFREFSNKIIHSETFSWEFKKDIPPRLICYARQDEKRKWNKAFVDLAGLAGLCGQFMS